VAVAEYLLKTCGQNNVLGSYLRCYGLKQCFQKCGTRTTSGTRKDFIGYVADNKLQKIVPGFCLLSDELLYKEILTNLLLIILA
jgi:hypothetical protein